MNTAKWRAVSFALAAMTCVGMGTWCFNSTKGRKPVAMTKIDASRLPDSASQGALLPTSSEGVGVSAGEDDIFVLRSFKLRVRYSIAENLRSITIKRAERVDLFGDDIEDSTTFRVSFKITGVEFLGSERLLVFGKAGTDSVLEEWTLEYAPGSYICEVAGDGTLTTSLKGTAYIPPAGRAHSPIDTREELLRGSTFGLIKDVDFSIPNPDVVLVLREVGAVPVTTLLSFYNTVTQQWDDVSLAFGLPQMLGMDRIDVHQTQSGTVFCVISDVESQSQYRSQNRIVLLDSNLDNVFEQVHLFTELNSWRQSPYYEGSPLFGKSFNVFPEAGW